MLLSRPTTSILNAVFDKVCPALGCISIDPTLLCRDVRGRNTTTVKQRMLSEIFQIAQHRLGQGLDVTTDETTGPRIQKQSQVHVLQEKRLEDTTVAQHT